MLGMTVARIVELGLFVAGEKDRDLVAEIGERRRQRADDIREAAGLGKRNALGCRKGNVHESSRRGDRCSAGYAELDD